ncbi:MAG: hypothetical protein ABIP38_04250 [Steroidobacteraceae bacterium]
MKQIHMNGALLLMALTFGAAAAYAHEGMHGPGGKYDQDEDASLSLAEYTAYLKDNKQDLSKAASRFAALDTNKDGKLNSAEFIRGLVSEKTK